MMRRASVLAAALVAAAGCANNKSADQQAMESSESMEEAVRATMDDPETAVAVAEDLRGVIQRWQEERRLLAEERWDMFSDYRTTRDGFNAFYRTVEERREQTWGELIDVAMDARSAMTVDEWFSMYEMLNK